jgi:hypothetical protein
VDVLARRTLITRLSREKKWDEALKWSTEQQASAGVEFRDRLTHLDLVAVARKGELDAAIATAEAAFAKALPTDQAALMNWLRMAGRAEQALRWLQTLDPEVVSKPPIVVAQAECFVALKRWSDLETLTKTGDWKAQEYARFAYLALAAQQLGVEADASLNWGMAKNTAKSREQVSQLALLAARWNRPLELRQILWMATAQPKPEWALQMLHSLYKQDGDAAGLLRVAKAALERDPKNPQARNNVAMLSLLLQQDTANAMKMAQDLHTEQPANALFASTYAYALHLAGRTPEGLAVLKKLSPEALREPSTAAYYAILLHASGAKEEAAPYLEIAKKAPLLPAEKELVAGLTP